MGKNQFIVALVLFVFFLIPFPTNFIGSLIPDFMFSLRMGFVFALVMCSLVPSKAFRFLIKNKRVPMGTLSPNMVNGAVLPKVIGANIDRVTPKSSMFILSNTQSFIFGLKFLNTPLVNKTIQLNGVYGKAKDPNFRYNKLWS